MTKKVNTELARVRAAAKTLRKATEEATSVVAKVQPAISSTLADARQIVAAELESMKKAVASGQGLQLKDAKKLQALVGVLGSAQNIEKAQIPEMDDISDEELDAELHRLQSGDQEDR